MDHVQNMMEKYAATLEAQINERTKELMEEKKKADILLYRILPKYFDRHVYFGKSQTFVYKTHLFSKGQFTCNNTKFGLTMLEQAKHNLSNLMQTKNYTLVLIPNVTTSKTKKIRSI